MKRTLETRKRPEFHISSVTEEHFQIHGRIIIGGSRSKFGGRQTNVLGGLSEKNRENIILLKKTG